MKLLLVDDEAVALRFLSGVLAGRARTETAADGASAVAAFARALDQDDPFDAVILDIMMPGMDGIEAARRMRALERGRGREGCCRLLMLSCLDGAEHQMAAQYDAGADGYLTKPVEAADLLAALANLDLPDNPLDGAE
ncbi:response regulator [Desulfovibrio aminophilus]|nr:response regulator [Desulfovibrio aminophilus]MCM0755491.1 response regulator [Desulfovibrio aminophilus]